MSTLQGFKKEAPARLALSERACCAQDDYKYCLCGKGCVLGVLFETSVDVHFEWLTEKGCPVPYGPEIRYKSWPKREVARLIQQGVWEATPTDEVALGPPTGGQAPSEETGEKVPAKPAAHWIDRLEPYHPGGTDLPLN
jgi:hypothetical protein